MSNTVKLTLQKAIQLNMIDKVIQCFTQNKTWFIGDNQEIFYFYPFLIKRILYHKHSPYNFVIKWRMARIYHKKAQYEKSYRGAKVRNKLH